MFVKGTYYEVAIKPLNMTARKLRKWNKYKEKKILEYDFMN